MKPSFPLKPNQLSRLLAIVKESDKTDTQKEIRESSVPMDKSCAKLPDWIGRYKITRMLGKGGMGIVYQAAQEHPVKRTVALKVIKPGMDSMQVIIRFENEQFQLFQPIAGVRPICEPQTILNSRSAWPSAF